jgi:hypothetical protein
LALSAPRAVTAETAPEYLGDHRAAIAAKIAAHRANEARKRATPHPIRERVRALAAAQAEWQGDPNVPALVRLLADDPESKINQSSARLDEMIQSGRDGSLVMHRISPRRAE